MTAHVGDQMQNARLATGTLRARELRVGTHHTAFLRALINGLDWRDAAERYLFEGYSGRRQIARLLRELEQAFTRASHLIGSPGLMEALPISRLLPIELRAADVVALHAPAEAEARVHSYKEWLQDQPSGFFSEEDLRDRYADYLRDRKAAPAQVTRKQLGRWDVGRALEVLRELERHVAKPPAPAHACAAWMHPRLAQHLKVVGVSTLGELVAYMNRHGHRWYARVSRIGRQRAQSLTRWLAEKPAVGAALTLIATRPRTQLTFADFASVRAGRGRILPLELAVLPSTLSGIDGSNRERQRICQLDVHTDRDAIVRWLHAVAMNDNTFRAYQREAERVLQWCLYEKGKPLSSMTVDDVIEYREFLIALPRPDLPWHWTTTRNDWIGAKSHPRTSPNWRPFEGRMSRPSIERSLRTARLLFAWLHERAYLAGNPWAAVGTSLRSHALFRTTGATKKQRAEKSLSRDEWAALLAIIDAMPDGERRARAAVLVRLGVMAGLRREELANATTGWFTTRAKRRMTLSVVGKGGVPREVPVFAELQDAMGDYLEWRGLPRDPTACPADTPVLAKLSGNEMAEIDEGASAEEGGAAEPGRVALTPSRIYALSRRLIEKAADAVEEQGDEQLAKEMRLRARAHALRHTFGTTCAERGIPIPVVQAWMGHAKPETTAIYFTPRAGQRFDLIDQAFGEPAAGQ